MFWSNDLDNSLNGETVKGTRLSRGAVDHVLKMAVPSPVGDVSTFVLKISTLK